MITLLWAQTNEGVIGKDNKLPWNIKEEMQHFIRTSKGKTVLMGRNTWDSLHVKPLPGRKNIVLTTREMDMKHTDLVSTKDFDSIIKEYANNPNNELVCIGGKQIYDRIMVFADKLIISFIKNNYEGNVYAPDFDKSAYKITEVQEYSEFIVKVFERK